METRRLRNIKQRDEMLRKLGFKKVHAVLDIRDGSMGANHR